MTTSPERPAASPPNPGSDEAQALGCICAVMDNNHGRFAPWPPDGWWITEDCPVHNFEEYEHVDA